MLSESQRTLLRQIDRQAGAVARASSARDRNREILALGALLPQLRIGASDSLKVCGDALSLLDAASDGNDEHTRHALTALSSTIDGFLYHGDD